MDIQLYVREEGAGTPLILLHGNGESGEYFAHQISHFSSNYRVLAIDTRGQGKSPRGVKPFTISQFVEDLHDYMEEERIEKAHILGFSDGGNIALMFTLAYPERVEKLILNGANLNPKGVKRRFQIPIEAGYWIASLFAKKSQKAREHAELMGLMVKEPNILPEHLKKIKSPTLVIAGTKDMIVEKHTRLIHQSIPGAQLVLMEGDHFIAAKHPEEFNQAVENFLLNR